MPMTVGEMRRMIEDLPNERKIIVWNTEGVELEIDCYFVEKHDEQRLVLETDYAE